VRSFLGKRAESTLEVTTAEPGREFSLRTVSGPFKVSIGHRLEPAGDGTVVLLEVEADPGKLFGLGGPLLRKAAERRARGDFERSWCWKRGPETPSPRD
jgi:hypothetical protein